MKPTYLLGASFCAVVLASSPRAQDAQDESHAIDAVTIIGKRLDIADVPGSAHVVGTDELAEFAQSDVLRVLRSVPGVYIQEEEGFGLRPNIGIRGSGLDRSARIALLEDGVLIAPAPYAAASAYYFPTQRRMSAVEVLKGPASVAVGPRTTGGAMNLISTPIPDAMSASADLRIGENQTLDAHITAGNRGDRFSWLLETVQAQSEGCKSIQGPVGGDTGFDIKDYVAKIRFDSLATSSVNQSLRIKLGYTDQHSDETYLGLTDNDFRTSPYSRYAASANDNFESSHEQYQASYVVEIDQRWRAEVTAYRNNFARNWYKLQDVAGESLNAVLSDPSAFTAEFDYLTGAADSPDDALQIRANNRDYYSQGLQGNIEWDLGFGETDILLNTGIRLHKDEEDRFQHQDGYRIENGTLILTTASAGGSTTNRVSDAEVSSLFIDIEIRTGKWIFTPGVRFEDIDLTREDYATDDPTRAQGPTRTRSNNVQVFIPGAGALYRFSENWRFLAGVHKGFNPPGPGSSATEESSVNIEAGARYIADNLRFEAIYFRNDYDNLVGTVTDSTGGGQIGDQFDGGEVIVSGVELSSDYTFGAGGFDFPVALRYTWTNEAQFKNAFNSGFEPWGEVEIGDALPYIPEHQLRVSTSIENERFRAGLAANYVGKMRTNAGQGTFDPTQAIDSRIVWDAIAAWQFTENLSTYVKVDNLFDKVYVAARRPAGVRPGLPRTAYLGLTFRL